MGSIEVESLGVARKMARWVVIAFLELLQKLAIA